MLGHQLFSHLVDYHQVAVTVRGDLSNYHRYGCFTENNTYANIDIRSSASLAEVFADFRSDVVVNAIGIVKQRDDANAAIPSLEINALFPHRLSLWCKMMNARLIHFSTDCIFSGMAGNYTEESVSDATDLYGRTKYLGEVHEPHCITLRTSIIGLELSRNKSLIEWFLAQRGPIKGYKHAIYTGLTTLEISRLINTVVIEHPKLSGVWHVASKPISKYELLTKIGEKIDRENFIIEADETFQCDRSLDGSSFAAAIGYVAPSWDSMLDELAEQIKERDQSL